MTPIIEPVTPPTSGPTERPARLVVIGYVVGACLLFILNFWLAWVIQGSPPTPISEEFHLGAAVGYFIFPLLVVMAICALWKSNRRRYRMLLCLFWTLVGLFLLDVRALMKITNRKKSSQQTPWADSGAVKDLWSQTNNAASAEPPVTKRVNAVDPAAQELFEAHKAKAEKGDASAQFELGCCFLEGQGVAKDTVAAVKWFRKAADQSLALAQGNLGLCLLTGEGVKQDAVEAVKYFRAAAEQNVREAQCNLGFCYVKGEGVAQSKAEGAKWFRKAAEQDLPEAQCYLGFCLLNGEGIAKDTTEAAKWFRKAAEQNLALAQLSLGVCYEKGQGVVGDDVQAYKWFSLAAAGGLELANRNIKLLEGRIRTDQIAEAQRLVREFRPNTESD